MRIAHSPLPARTYTARVACCRPTHATRCSLHATRCMRHAHALPKTHLPVYRTLCCLPDVIHLVDPIWFSLQALALLFPRLLATPVMTSQYTNLPTCALCEGPDRAVLERRCAATSVRAVFTEHLSRKALGEAYWDEAPLLADVCAVAGRGHTRTSWGGSCLLEVLVVEDTVTCNAPTHSICMYTIFESTRHHARHRAPAARCSRHRPCDARHRRRRAAPTGASTP